MSSQGKGDRSPEFSSQPPREQQQTPADQVTARGTSRLRINPSEQAEPSRVGSPDSATPTGYSAGFVTFDRGYRLLLYPID